MKEIYIILIKTGSDVFVQTTWFSEELAREQLEATRREYETMGSEDRVLMIPAYIQDSVGEDDDSHI